MGIIGGTLGYWLLTRICPEGETGYLTGTAYANRSKLAALFGPGFFSELQGRTVIDFGCGRGDQAIEMAKRGAGRVIGVDINESFLAEGRRRAIAEGVAERCFFTTAPDERADVIVSVDAFEHFQDPAAVLRTMDDYLAAGGKVAVTFGPTWLHPLGGHLFSVFPWAHLVFTERALLRWRKTIRPGQTATTIAGCGLNKMTIRRFLQIVAESPFRFERLALPPIRGLTALTHPLLREFGTSVVQCTLVRKDDAARERRSVHDATGARQLAAAMYQ